MAGEVTVTVGLQIRNGNFKFTEGNTTFKDDQSLAAGVGPGLVLVSTEGTDIDMSAIPYPGWCKITNISPTDGGSAISIGLYDPETDRYYPIWEVGPGQVHAGKFDEQFQWEEYPASGLGTGTGTGGSGNRLRLRAKAHACYARVECANR